MLHDRNRGQVNSNTIAVIIVLLALVMGVVVFFRIDTTGKSGSGLGDLFDYDLTELRQVDPALILYDEIEGFETELTVTQAVAVDGEDRILIAGDRKIVTYSDAGAVISEIETADPPQCLTVADDGKIYVGLIDRVAFYDGTGQRMAVWERLDGNAVLTSIAVYENNVFVADAGNRTVLRYDIEGKLLNRIGERNEESDFAGIILPSPYFDVAVTPDGVLRASNPGRHQVAAFEFEGEYLLAWGGASSNIKDFCGCCNPINIALLADGGFVTSEKGLTRVKVYDSTGEFVGVVAGPNSFAEHDRIFNEQRAEDMEGGLDLAVDSQGRVIVLDPATNEIRIFVPKQSDTK